MVHDYYRAFQRSGFEQLSRFVELLLVNVSEIEMSRRFQVKVRSVTPWAV